MQQFLFLIFTVGNIAESAYFSLFPFSDNFVSLVFITIHKTSVLNVNLFLGQVSLFRLWIMWITWCITGNIGFTFPFLWIIPFLSVRYSIFAKAAFLICL